MEEQTAIPDGRWVVASFAAIAVLLITLSSARPAPVHGIDASAIAEASIIPRCSSGILGERHSGGAGAVVGLDVAVVGLDVDKCN